ncbi:DMT family transporter [Radiobacillus sp. PE A8.2]|uniref:DMT family transporter n=1 Tax=Radiobacillus sp. PE A8.2 TaxID=3380349 RepID=UPI00388F3ED9
MAYLMLAIAIVTEIIGGSMLKMSEGFTRLIPTIAALAGYAVSFYFLSLALKDLPIGLTYAIWAGVGTAVTVLIGVFFWKEAFSVQTLIGLLAIIIGVTVINMPKWT